MNTSHPKQFKTGDVIAIAATHAIHDTYQAFLAPILPELIKTLSLSKADAGWLAAIVQLPSIFQPLIGKLADRFNLKFLMYLTPLLTIVLMCLLGISPSYISVAIILLIVGISSAGIHSVGPVMVGNNSGDKIGRGMSFWMVGGELGRTLGPLMVVTALGFLSLQQLPWLITIGALICIPIFYRIKDLPAKDHFLENTASQIPWRDAVKEMFPIFGPVGMIILARAFIDSSLSTFLPTFLTEQGASLWLAGASYSVLEAAGIIGALVGGSISDHLGRRPVLFLAMTLTSVFTFILLFAPSYWKLPVLLALGFVSLSISPVVMAVVQESFPKNRAFANGIYMALGFVIRSIAVVLVGKVGDWVGLQFAFTISAVIILFGLPFIFLLPRRKNHASIE